MSSVVFTWPADDKVKEVIVTGTFDNWANNLPLIKQKDGSYSLEVPMPVGTDKIEFKFVVNGSEWMINEDFWTIIDDSGNINNIIEFDQEGKIKKTKNNVLAGGKTEAGKTEAGKTEVGKTEVGKTEVGKTIIPESGLSIPTNKAEDKVATTVMPSTENIQTTPMGEPGIVIPDKENLSAFEEVRDVDAKELNAEMAKEDEKEKAKDQEQGKQTKYVKKVKKLVPAGSGANDGDGDAAGEEREREKGKEKKKGFLKRFRKAFQ